MKKNYLLMMGAFLTVTFANATIRTVSNLPSTLAQYSTIQGAINASSSGDTVYVHGSPISYASFTISNKQLVIIGPGWSPVKNLPHKATVSGCSIDGASSSNTEIQGFFFTGTVVISTNHPNNIRLIRNRFNSQVYIDQGGSTTYTGYLFQGNWFDNAFAYVVANSSSTYQNFLFQNNYFFMSAAPGYSISGFTISSSVVFDHNLWFGPASGTIDCFSTNCKFLTITNNIFVRRNAANNNSSSTFNNNITYYPAGSTAPSDPWAINGNFDGGGNVSNQDPQMAAQSSVNGGTNDPLLDFTIATGPANNAGLDGKDMGLMYDAAGSLNWTTSRSARLPYIFSMNVINPTISLGGTLNVALEARKNN